MSVPWGASRVVSRVMDDTRRHESNAVNGARVNTQLAAGAVISNHDVHLLGSTDDRVNGTDLNADRATDTPLLIDLGDT